MTEAEFEENVRAFENLAGRLEEMAAEVQTRLDSAQARSRSYSAAYSMVIRSIEDAAVTANAVANVSRTRLDRATDGTRASA